MVIIKTDEELQNIREGGKRLAKILHTISEVIRPGMSAVTLDELARTLIADIGDGDTPSFLHYRPAGAKKQYPAALCVSVNDEVVHGIPREDKILHDGDIVGLDLGLRHKNTYVDSAITVAVGEIDADAKKLIQVTREALYAGIGSAVIGNKIGDISATIQSFARKNGYGIIHELAGHGVGREVHEEPFIPNFGKAGSGEKLVAGMVLALEPMFAEGAGDVKEMKDGFTFSTADGSRSAHFEHTIIITPDGPEIVTE